MKGVRVARVWGGVKGAKGVKGARDENEPLFHHFIFLILT